MRIAPASRGLRGSATVPGDKSIAHRALLLAAVARGRSVVRGFAWGADNRSTASACRALGVEPRGQGTELEIDGRGWGGLVAPAKAIDCENSGTTMRLLAGMLAGRPFTSRLDGDGSLRRRPMRRVVDPLARMGAVIACEGEGGRAPLRIEGRELHGAGHVLAVASAQVKSALLLAGLQASGETRIEEPAASRDHTERMLGDFGATIARGERWVALHGPQELVGARVDLPGDFSCASFLLVAALLLPGSEVRLVNVGVNPTRTGLLDALTAMGATITADPRASQGSEPCADLVARTTALSGTKIAGEMLLRAIDEFPILCVAAALADGTTELRDASELRVKESDRIATMAGVLSTLGARVEEQPDGLVITGPTRFTGGHVDPRGDHRIAMAAAVVGLLSADGVTIAGAECADVSFPGFYEVLARLASGSP